MMGVVGVDRAVLFKLATSRGFERVARGIPGVEDLAWRAGRRYVAGQHRSDALTAATQLMAAGHGVSIDLFGERVTDLSDAADVVSQYGSLSAALPEPPADVWLSVDLTHLALEVDPVGTADRLAAIVGFLPAGRRLQVGAEDATRADAVLACIRDVAARGGADRLGATVQANLLRSTADLDAMISAGVHVRLVKGAYVESAGAHPYGEQTDIAFLRLAGRLAKERHPWSMATHDGRLREAILLAFGPTPVEHLYGVRPDVLDDLHRRGVETRVYVPYGQDWFRYWLRRVAESRGA